MECMKEGRLSGIVKPLWLVSLADLKREKEAAESWTNLTRKQQVTN